ncbi:protein phosphatase 2C domain-containing protein [Fictibacillus sp. KU28468]|uniref:protein phosphatase 2C domain-containing protein n=1 Tax=Fictibacillus sp. KU28468 TaxID=2991053 RepID=UPI00223E4836|nr:protein phosphatase 2C domain-containing protein [Fictibacillus sp. KU28468]UZJ77981.1 protein phosphatase 2C domain-containing protein [Fictibacillus sp. KU28468]
MKKLMNEINWVGSSHTYIDQPDISSLHHITVGRYGGNSLSGANKNEDGCLVWACEKGDWEFAVILDAHYSAESAQLVVEELEAEKERLLEAVRLQAPDCFTEVESRIVSLFKSAEFRAKCQRVKGETACLIAFRKENYVWWFSIGDCVLYLCHPELADFKQYQLNQRNFYEWVGKENTFELPVPSYSSGVRELRKGKTVLLLATDGMVECPDAGFEDAEKVYRQFADDSMVEEGVQRLLQTVETHHGRDSATLIAWTVHNTEEGSEPSDGRVPPELRKE